MNLIKRTFLTSFVICVTLFSHAQIHDDIITEILVSPNREYLFSKDYTGLGKLWTFPDLQPMASYESLSKYYISFSPNSKYLRVDNEIIDLKSLEKSKVSISLPGEALWSMDGEHLYFLEEVSTKEGCIKKLNIQSGSVECDLEIKDKILKESSEAIEYKSGHYVMRGDKSIKFFRPGESKAFHEIDLNILSGRISVVAEESLVLYPDEEMVLDVSGDIPVKTDRKPQESPKHKYKILYSKDRYSFTVENEATGESIKPDDSIYGLVVLAAKEKNKAKTVQQMRKAFQSEAKPNIYLLKEDSLFTFLDGYEPWEILKSQPGYTESEDWLMLADYEISKGNLEVARAYFDKAIEKGEVLEKGCAGRAVTYYLLEEYENTIADCNECLKLNPDNTTCLTYRGYGNDKLGNMDKAISDYERAVALNERLHELAYKVVEGTYKSRAIAFKF